MKPIPALIAATFVFVLVLSPFAAFAVGSITFSSPASGATYKGSQSYTISGSVSPAPGGPDNVFITVKNPSGTPVDAQSVSATPSTGAFTYATAVGGTSNWVTGTYTITATDSFSATGTTTFTYTAQAVITPGSGLAVHVDANSPAFAGQSVEVAATVTWANGSLASVSSWLTAEYFTPGATTPTSLGSPTKITEGTTVVAYTWTVALPSTAADGLYLVHIQANASGTASYGTGSWTVNGQVAKESSVAALASTLASIQTSISSIQGSLSSLSTASTNIQTSVQALQSSVGSLSGLAAKIDGAVSGINTTQTYVLVVAVLAAITLVLELAVLVRKLS
jgi:hypothetical protein